jgi:hypothetical protein
MKAIGLKSDTVRHIGLIGLAGSGKDTAAKALIKLGYYRMAFADELKDLAFEFGWNGEKDEAGRRLLQELGMAGRRYFPGIWIQHIAWKIAPNGPPIVFTDVRFQNEANFVRHKGGIIVRIVRPEQIADEHESELNQSQIVADYEVVNDGSIEDLHKKIAELTNL